MLDLTKKKEKETEQSKLLLAYFCKENVLDILDEKLLERPIGRQDGNILGKLSSFLII